MQQPMPFQPTRRAFIGAALALGLPGTAMAATNAQRLVRAARRQVGVTLSYDPAYSVLRFPHGDVDRAKRVCTDVVLRAFRDALGAHLQHRNSAVLGTMVSVRVVTGCWRNIKK